MTLHRDPHVIPRQCCKTCKHWDHSSPNLARKCLHFDNQNNENWPSYCGANITSTYAGFFCNHFESKEPSES